jgi:PAS domain S-box-containing protein
MGLGAKIRTRLASFRHSPPAVALAAIALFAVLFGIFSAFDLGDGLLEWIERHEVFELDEALLAGFIVSVLLTAGAAWEMRQRSADLQQSRDLLRTALDSLKDGAALFDKNERLVFWNEGFIRTSPALRDIVAPGVSFTEMITRMMAQGRYLGVDRNWVETRVRQFRALEPVENHMRDPDGKERWAYVHLHRTRDGGTFLIREDITARKQAEAELATVRQRLADAIDSLSDGVALFDKDERLILYNQSYHLAVSRVIGNFRLGMSFEEEIRSLDRKGFYVSARGDDWIARRLRAFRALDPVEYRAQDILGQDLWIKVHHYRTRDGGTLLIREDVTAQKQSDLKVQAGERLLGLFIEHAPAALAMFDREMRYLHVSRRWLTDYGLGERDLRGLSHYDVFPEIPEAWKEAHRRGLAGEVLRMDAESFTRLDGSVQWLKWELRPWFDATGAVGGIILFTEDITARRKAESDLESSRNLLQTALDSVGGGIALFDKDERLVLHNQSLATNLKAFPGALAPGIFFVDFVKTIAAGGGYKDAGPDWIAERIRKFRDLEPVELHRRDPDGTERWHLIHHYRTRDGGTLRIGTEITERKRAEAALAASQQLLQSALDSIAAGVALFDKDERLVMWNGNYVDTRPQLSGYIKAGGSFTDIIRHLVEQDGYVGVDQAWVTERVRRFRALESFEAHMRDPDGGERWALVNHYRTRDGGTFLIRTDITARKRAEAELASAQQRLADAIESISDGIVLFDKDERLALFNRRYAAEVVAIADIFKPGVTFENFVRALAKAGYYGPAKVGDEAWVRERLRRFRALTETEYAVTSDDGEQAWRLVRHFRTADGGTLLALSDITARKRMETELRSSQELLRTALESMNDGVALFDRDERLVLFNEEFVRFPLVMRDVVKIGLSFTEMTEKLFDMGGYIGKNRDWLERRIRCFRSLEPIEITFRDVDGSERWYNFAHHRTRDGGTLMVRKDVTDRVLALGEIEHARGVAEQANEAKTKFLASMSHELRTPLNAILGFAQMIELGIGKMPEAQAREYLGIVLKSGQHLLDLLSNILEFSKFESQGEPRTFIAMSSVDLSRQCVDMVREEAKNRGVTIVNDADAKETEARFVGDPLWVRQILLNLLVNAVKYNRPGGTATVTCARRADGRVRMAVADTGIGIPKEIQDRVFEPFQRLGREAGQIEGAGVGLALSRQLVLRMGGEIGFDSEPGRGSTFWFDLPAVEDEVERVA